MCVCVCVMKKGIEQSAPALTSGAATDRRRLGALQSSSPGFPVPPRFAAAHTHSQWQRRGRRGQCPFRGAAPAGTIVVLPGDRQPAAGASCADRGTAVGTLKEQRRRQVSATPHKPLPKSAGAALAHTRRTGAADKVVGRAGPAANGPRALRHGKDLLHGRVNSKRNQNMVSDASKPGDDGTAEQR